MRVVSKIVSNGHGYLDADYIVIHETANPGASALNHVNYWQSDPTYAVHYVGDWTGVAYHCVPDNRLCWQVGNGNDRVVGIELCHATNKKDFDKVWTLGVEWAAWMLKSRGWGTGRLLSHYDCTKIWGGSDHTDPIGYFSQYGKSWSQFKQAVAAKMKEATVHKQEPGKAINDAGLYYRAHVQRMGWLAPVHDGQVAGTTGNAYRMEAFKLTPPAGLTLDVDAHIEGDGWKTFKGVKKGEGSGTGSSTNDPIIGTVGKAKGIQAIALKPTENKTGKKLKYRVHVGGFGWGPWTYAPYTAGTTGIGRNIEAIQIALV